MQQALSNMVKRVGPDRVMFGSDYPFGGSERLRLALRQIETLNISLDHRKKILGANAARVIGLG